MSESIRAVERALDVLGCFSTRTPELSMTQIADQVGLNKSTVHRLLATLERKRFVERDPKTGIYRAGIHLLQLAYLATETNDLRSVSEPILRRLWEAQRETVDLAVLDGSEVLFISVLESPQRVKLAAAVGQRLPAFCTASGKAILAYLPREAVLRVLEGGMRQYTPDTITSADQFFRDLEACRQAGFAVTEAEYEAGINAVSAPVMGRNEQPLASVSLAGPAFRLTREMMLSIGPQVKATADEISREIQQA